MKRKKYVRPLITVIEVEQEPLMVEYSTWNPGNGENDPGIDIKEGIPPADGTDLSAGEP